ncbi:Uncharacterised protein [Mycobacteroides abscessus subsp. abscessus]|nr:Uncharacterised protein [Mycobacteroides abscessus subsp. abscessus]
MALAVAGSATDSAPKSLRNSCQLESTEDGSSLNRRYISSTSHSFCPNCGFEPFTAVFASLRLVRYSVRLATGTRLTRRHRGRHVAVP